MYKRDLRETPTGARLHYLSEVERKGTYHPRHGVTANHCLQIGWTESVVRVTAGPRRGDIVAFRELFQHERLLGDYEDLGQRLTPAGKAFLDKHLPNRSGK